MRHHRTHTAHENSPLSTERWSAGMDRKRSRRGRWASLVALVALSAGGFAACASDPPSAAGSDGGGADGGSDGWGGDPSTTTTTGGGGDELPCPYQGEAIVEPSTLPACPTTLCGGGAHCVPTSLVPAEQQASLADCDAESKCVPDPFIATKG